MSDAALTLTDLVIRKQGRSTPVLDGLSLSLSPGDVVLMLDESNSGTAALMRALTGALLPDEDVTGAISIRGAPAAIKPTAAAPRRPAYWPAPDGALSPHASVAKQLASAVSRKSALPMREASADFASALERLAGAPPVHIFERTPNSLSAEQLAWALLACAIAQNPEVLLADHPLRGLMPSATAALLQACLAEQKRQNFALLFASADANVAKGLPTGRAIVLRQGCVVEDGPIEQIGRGRENGSAGATSATVPSPADVPRAPVRAEPVLQVFGLRLRGTKNVWVEPLTFELRRGASLALIGEPGSGRRTLLRTLVGLKRPAEGRVIFDSVEIGALSRRMLTLLRRRLAIVAGAKDAVDPRLTVSEIVAEPLRSQLHLSHELLASYRDAALKRVGLGSFNWPRLVAELNGFDQRRLQIARAIVTVPTLCILDEPLRGLDVPAQNVVLDLLRDLRKTEGTGFLLITNDFAVARALAEDALVFDQGRVVERGPIADLATSPREAVTKRMVEAAKVGLS